MLGRPRNQYRPPREENFWSDVWHIEGRFKYYLLAFLLTYGFYMCLDEDWNIRWTKNSSLKQVKVKNNGGWDLVSTSPEVDFEMFDDFHEMISWNLNPWGVRKLLSAQYSQEESSDIPNAYCHRLLSEFGLAITKFDKCVIDYQSPPSSFCRTCSKQYEEAEETRNRLFKQLKEPVGATKSCGTFLADKNQMNILAREVIRVFGPEGNWAVANCKHCFTNDSYRSNQLKEDVRHFFAIYSGVHNCFSDNFDKAENGSYFPVSNRTLCQVCRKEFNNIETYFFNTWGYLKLIKDKKACQDVVDAFNYTINVWNHELECGIQWEPAEFMIGFKMIGCMFLLYVIFILWVALINCLLRLYEEEPPYLIRMETNEDFDPTVMVDLCDECRESRAEWAQVIKQKEEELEAYRARVQEEEAARLAQEEEEARLAQEEEEHVEVEAPRPSSLVRRSQVVDIQKAKSH